jgi:hypothetical protein
VASVVSLPIVQYLALAAVLASSLYAVCHHGWVLATELYPRDLLQESAQDASAPGTGRNFVSRVGLSPAKPGSQWRRMILKGTSRWVGGRGLCIVQKGRMLTGVCLAGRLVLVWAAAGVRAGPPEGRGEHGAIRHVPVPALLAGPGPDARVRGRAEGQPLGHTLHPGHRQGLCHYRPSPGACFLCHLTQSVTDTASKDQQPS